MAASSTLLGGRYRLLGPVGEGGMAVVHRARDELLGRDVAIKLLRPAQAGDPEFVRRFRREARHAAQLHHPNVVTIHDLGTDPVTGADYIVMQLVHGPSLETLLAGGAPLPLGTALRIGVETANALEAAHNEGIVHRDVKPGNILIDADGSVRVADFGIARAEGGGGGGTTAGVVVGSPEYISPEQVVGEPVTPASDIYSLGVVLYQMITGWRPFQGDSAAAIALQRLRLDPPPPASIAPVPIEVDEIIRRAMARDPADRYATAEELSAALERFRVAHLGGVRRTGSQVRASDTQWIPVATAVAEPVDWAVPDSGRTVVARPSTEVDAEPAAAEPAAAEPASADPDARIDRRRRRRAVGIVVPLLALVLVLVGAVASLGRVSGDRTGESGTPITTTSGSPASPGLIGSGPTPSAAPTLAPAPSPTVTRTPGATSTPTPEPPVAPVPTQRPASARSPAETVRTFYALVARHEFDAAARLWSASMRERYPPDRYIDGRFAATTGITLRRVETTSRTGDTARVAVDLLEYRSDSATRHWVGSWDLVRTSSGWLMNQPHF